MVYAERGRVIWSVLPAPFGATAIRAFTHVRADTADTASGPLLDQAGLDDPSGDMECTGPGEVLRQARVDEEELRMFEPT